MDFNSPKFFPPNFLQSLTYSSQFFTAKSFTVWKAVAHPLNITEYSCSILPESFKLHLQAQFLHKVIHKSIAYLYWIPSLFISKLKITHISILGRCWLEKSNCQPQHPETI